MTTSAWRGRGGRRAIARRLPARCDPALFELGVPVLGICYGMQMACQLLNCDIRKTPNAEYGRSRLTILDGGDLMADIPTTTTVWMSHGDQITDLDGQFVTLAETPTCRFAAVRHKKLPFYGVQFHPEVTHTPHGVDLLRNFLYEICKCTGTWHMSDFVDGEFAKTWNEACLREIRRPLAGRRIRIRIRRVYLAGHCQIKILGNF